jgi:hypothetical protein
MSNFDILDLPINGVTTDVPETAGKFATDDFGNLFQLCLVKSGASIAISAGHPAGWWSNDSTGYTVTTDLSHMAGLGSTAGCGMFMAAIGGHSVTSNNIYAWILRRGNAGTAGVSTIKTDGGVAAGEVLFPIADGRWGGISVQTGAATSTETQVGRNYVAFSRVADNTSSQIVAPLFVEVNGFNF